MIEPTGILHFTISVSDPDRSERFYCDVLGCKLVQRVPSLGMVFLRAGDDYVVLCRSKTPIRPNPGNDIMVHHAFRVDVKRYDAAIDDLRAHGIEILFEESRREGVFQGRQAYFHDPDKNVIEIIALDRIGDYGTDDPLNTFTHAPPDS